MAIAAVSLIAKGAVQPNKIAIDPGIMEPEVVATIGQWKIKRIGPICWMENSGTGTTVVNGTIGTVPAPYCPPKVGSGSNQEYHGGCHVNYEGGTGAAGAISLYADITASGAGTVRGWIDKSGNTGVQLCWLHGDITSFSNPVVKIKGTDISLMSDTVMRYNLRKAVDGLNKASEHQWGPFGIISFKGIAAPAVNGTTIGTTTVLKPAHRTPFSIVQHSTSQACTAVWETDGKINIYNNSGSVMDNMWGCGIAISDKTLAARPYRKIIYGGSAKGINPVNSYFIDNFQETTISNGTCRLYKFGKLVVMDILGSSMAFNAGTEYVYTTLPEIYRPKEENVAKFLGIHSLVNGRNPLFMWIRSNGKVSMYSATALTTSYSLWGQAMWESAI